MNGWTIAEGGRIRVMQVQPLGQCLTALPFLLSCCIVSTYMGNH